MNKAQGKAKFLTYCKMICFGGSECGKCSCECPADCELQDDPEYLEARRQASTRMLQTFKTMINTRSR